MTKRFPILLLLLTSYAQSLFSQTNDSAILHVSKTADFEVDGKGSASQWQSASWTTLTKRKGNVNYGTRFKILYSDKGIYCLYECQDEKITSTMKNDFDDIYNEDVVEAFFWTDESSVIYFEYELSPYNVELPILVPNYNGKFLGWRPWHYEGDKKTRKGATIKKEDDKVVGWTAEFFIPYKLLQPLQNVPAQKGTKWRANFYRIDYDNGTSHYSWRPTRKNFHDYESYGTIVFD